MLPSRIILGTGSTIRKLIISELGIKFSAVKADIDEYAIGDRSSGSGAKDLVLLIGMAKADAILASLPHELRGPILLTADTVVVFENRILEKPKSDDEVRKFVKGFGTAPLSVVGSIVLTDTVSGRKVHGTDTATLRYSEIPDAVVETLLSEGDVFFSAGALLAEHPLMQQHQISLDGTMNCVMGISTDLLAVLYEELCSKK